MNRIIVGDVLDYINTEVFGFEARKDGSPKFNEQQKEALSVIREEYNKMFTEVGLNPNVDKVDDALTDFMKLLDGANLPKFTTVSGFYQEDDSNTSAISVNIVGDSDFPFLEFDEFVKAAAFAFQTYPALKKAAEEESESAEKQGCQACQQCRELQVGQYNSDNTRELAKIAQEFKVDFRVKAAESGQEHKGDTLTIGVGSEVLPDFYLMDKRKGFLAALSNLIGSVDDEVHLSSVKLLVQADVSDEVKRMASEVNEEIGKYCKGKELAEKEFVSLSELFNTVFPLFAFKLRSPFVKFEIDVKVRAGKLGK